ncbi:hypothetical protein N7491_005797 [Penicillium cf. griseofulvum]|uniref:Uncharacterized protein n=1 Tax=Penicillium cf. griseofulvum TaxID=2972120 RepID=A0A9W9J885_9EURO|nr:hypothetical protein N7472_008480 [Penicillium cf. griseofulvum]KAJ5435202.1 hypothetical protein N7491_005797 [Penicillium cf. griseofulvum]KAJ5453034.1 hypothetical protein N7445_001217 [Penicillium cf. griseofulvum]
MQGVGEDSGTSSLIGVPRPCSALTTADLKRGGGTTAMMKGSGEWGECEKKASCLSIPGVVGAV